MCVSVCKERERERENDCESVCVRVRESESETVRENENACVCGCVSKRGLLVLLKAVVVKTWRSAALVRTCVRFMLAWLFCSFFLALIEMLRGLQ